MVSREGAAVLLDPRGHSAVLFFAYGELRHGVSKEEMAEHAAQLNQIARQTLMSASHNPAVLDGLDLHDPEQRLFVIHRTSRGPTKARRVAPPQPIEGQLPMKLSEAFLRGHLGGLPKNF